MYEKPYFSSPGVSWKNKKGQVNIIFTSTFWQTKYHISHHLKFRNKNFLVISKYHIYQLFAWKKRPHFPFPKGSRKELSVISKYHISINLLAQKNKYFSSPKNSHLSHFLKHHANFVNTKESSSFYQLPAFKRIAFYS